MGDYIETRINDQLWHVPVNGCIYDSVIDLNELPKWWPDDDLRLSEISGIQQAGCAGQAYMPAVTYHLANEHMLACGDDVLDYLYDIYGETPQPKKEISWSGMAVFYLSLAVENWCAQFDVENIIEQLQTLRSQQEGNNA